MTCPIDIRDKIAKIIQDKQEWAYETAKEDIDAIWLINPWELADKIIKALELRPQSLPIEPTNPIPDGQETPMP